MKRFTQCLLAAASLSASSLSAASLSSASLNTIESLHASSLVASNTPVADQKVLKEKMITEVEFFKSLIEVGYAPADWKKAHYGWDLNEQVGLAQQRIAETPNISIKDFQRIARDFFNAMRDYHVRIYFHSTESATLPFLVSGVDGRYYFTFIDRAKLSATSFPFTIGDELISFDGRPIHDVVSQLKQSEQRSANEATDQALAEIFLTNRFGAKAAIVPKGAVSIGVRSNNGKVKNYQLIWNYTSEKINNPTAHLTGVRSACTAYNVPEEKGRKAKRALLNQMTMSLPLFQELDKVAPHLRKNAHFIGARESFLPTLGKKLWKSDEDCQYDAYLFMTEDRKRVGYLRIPHYMLMDEDADQAAEIISLFEDMTDMLVIDQFNNPGGIVFHAYALASMLTDQPLLTPKQRMKVSQADVDRALTMLEILEEIEDDESAQEFLEGGNLFGYPVSYQLIVALRHHFQFTVDEWNKGKSLTDPYALFGIDHINPHPTARYTKPILFLVNQLDFSCGDFVPAILQDSKRVTLLGSRTAGAGGYVLEANYPNRFGISSIFYTGSIAERVDSNPIENLGVTPEIAYEITKDDIQNDYEGLVEKIHETISDMLQ